jgi:hypothetical protein
VNLQAVLTTTLLCLSFLSNSAQADARTLNDVETLFASSFIISNSLEVSTELAITTEILENKEVAHNNIQDLLEYEASGEMSASLKSQIFKISSAYKIDQADAIDVLFLLSLESLES